MPPGHVLIVSELGREAFADVRTPAVGETSFNKHALLLASQFRPTKSPSDSRPSLLSARRVARSKKIENRIEAQIQA